jgi:hypothetical protein
MIGLHLKDCPLNCMMWTDILERGPLMCTRAFVLINFAHSIYCKDMLSLSYAHDYQSKTTLNSEFATIFSKVGVGGSDLPFSSSLPNANCQSTRIYSFPVRQKHVFCNSSQFGPDKPNQLAVSSILCLHLSLFLSFY